MQGTSGGTLSFDARGGQEVANFLPAHQVEPIGGGGSCDGGDSCVASLVSPARSFDSSSASLGSDSSTVAEEELFALLDGEVAAEALSGGDTTSISVSEVLAMIG